MDDLDPQPVDPAVYALETKLIEQEHRLIRILENLWRYRGADADSGRKWAARKALLTWFLFPLNSGGGLGIAAVIAVLTLLLNYNANETLNRQLQIEESNRLASLNSEITSILDRINDHQLAGDTTGEIPRPIVARIVALSKALRPYRYLDPYNGKMTETLRSPERGQLFTAMVEMRPRNLASILQQCTFHYSDIPGVQIHHCPLLVGLKLNRAHLPNAQASQDTFVNAKLAEALLDNSDFNECLFLAGNLQRVSLRGGRLRNCTFEGTYMRGAQLRGVELKNCVFHGVDLDSADLRGVSYPMQAPNLKTVSMRGAIVNERFWKEVLQPAGIPKASLVIVPE